MDQPFKTLNPPSEVCLWKTSIYRAIIVAITPNTHYPNKSQDTLPLDVKTQTGGLGLSGRDKGCIGT